MNFQKWELFAGSPGAIFIHFVNSCIDHMDRNFIFDLRVNLDSFFSFLSFFSRVHCKIG